MNNLIISRNTCHCVIVNTSLHISFRQSSALLLSQKECYDVNQLLSTHEPWQHIWVVWCDDIQPTVYSDCNSIDDTLLFPFHSRDENLKLSWKFLNFPDKHNVQSIRRALFDFSYLLQFFVCMLQLPSSNSTRDFLWGSNQLTGTPEYYITSSENKPWWTLQYIWDQCSFERSNDIQASASSQMAWRSLPVSWVCVLLYNMKPQCLLPHNVCCHSVVFDHLCLQEFGGSGG